jgi:hypothetical protein
MSQYLVITPLVRWTPNGPQPYTHGDRIELEDPAEAQRLLDAGIVGVLPKSRELPVENAALKPAGAEKAVKAKKKE